LLINKTATSLPPVHERKMNTTKYHVGDVVSWMLGSMTGEAYFIGTLASDLGGRVLVLATASEVGIEIEARDCHATGRGSPARGIEYRQRYARQRPGRLAAFPFRSAERFASEG
jgi:hypothetical protein